MNIKYQDLIKYGVLIFLVIYVLGTLVTLFGLPPDALAKISKFCYDSMNWARLPGLDEIFDSVGKPMEPDLEDKPLERSTGNKSIPV